RDHGVNHIHDIDYSSQQIREVKIKKKLNEKGGDELEAECSYNPIRKEVICLHD
ncbi:hypothetical protein LCGC14_2043110, partial [marine sediment metagenome]